VRNVQEEVEVEGFGVATIGKSVPRNEGRPKGQAD